MPFACAPIVFFRAGLRICSSARWTPAKRREALLRRLRVSGGIVGQAPRVIAKVEWHPGELFPRVGFVVTNLPMDPDWIIHFCNQRGTAEQHIKEGKQAINGTRLSCKGMAQNEARLQLHALACNLGVFLQGADLPEEMADTKTQ
jgi:hypothetical protein